MAMTARIYRRLTQIWGAALFAGLSLSATHAVAAPPATSLTLTLRDHQFTPATLNAPAGERVRITLVNEDGATEEFDSDDLKTEQFVTPHNRVSFDIGPLRPGRYTFMGEFHADTAQGAVVATPQAAAQKE
jgi:plastocyanin